MLQTQPLLINRQDYEGMLDGPPYYQVIEGDLVMSPSPSAFHQKIITRLAGIIWSFLEKHPLGEIVVAPMDVFLNEINIYQPDLVFVAKEHLLRIQDRGVEGAPDWVAEVLSPRTSAYDRGSKRKIYAAAGVPEMWLINPETKEIEVFHLQENAAEPMRTFGSRAKCVSKTFPGLEFATAAIFK